MYMNIINNLNSVHGLILLNFLLCNPSVSLALHIMQNSIEIHFVLYEYDTIILFN